MHMCTCVHWKFGYKPSELNVGLHIDNTLEALCNTYVRQQKRECLAHEQWRGVQICSPPLCLFEYLATRANFKMRSKPIPRGSSSGCFGVFRLLFTLPVWLSAILNFGSLPSSTNVCQHRQTSGSVLGVKSKSGVVENVGAAFRIALQTTTVQKLFPVLVWWAPSCIGSPQCQATSRSSWPGRPWSKMWW
jgi:hypothetical protein